MSQLYNNSIEVSVILPCYNEKTNILPLVKAIHNELKNYKSYTHEIIIVDDNSIDKTYTYIKELNLPYVKAFLRTQNPSLGCSIGYGISKAKGKVLIVMDSDFNHPPKYIPNFLNLIKTADCVIGSRFLNPKIKVTHSRFRFLASLIFNKFYKLITKSNVTDNTLGFFAIKSEIIKKIPHNKIFYGFGDYFFRVLFFLQQLNINIAETLIVLGKRKADKRKSNLLNMLFKYTWAAIKIKLASVKKRVPEY